MKCTNRKIRSILVLVILILSFTIPLFSINAGIRVPSIDDYNVKVGDVITVSGDPDEVTTGSLVRVYWDIASGASAWLLNTTTGKPDGSYEVMITVPNAAEGAHYVWVVDVATGETARSGVVTVSPEIHTDRNSGLPGDELTVEGTGFDNEANINITLYNQTAPNVWDWNSTVFDSNDTIETDWYGTFAATFDIPAIDNGIYTINATDGTNWAQVNFTVNTAIRLTPDKGPEGTVVEVSGVGFTADVQINETNVEWDDTPGMQIDGDDVTVDDDGEFVCDLFIPSWGVGEYEINITDGIYWANTTFTIDGLAAIDVEPTYGSPGATVTVTGFNFTRKAGIEVTLDLNGTALGVVDTDADGEFTTTFTVPAVGFAQYIVSATTPFMLTNATNGFKVGIIAVIISPTSGPAGTEVTLTGVGFDPGTYNATLGDESVMTNGVVSGSETLSDTWYVPTMDPGTYSLLVEDDADNELSTTFTVTGTTSLTATPEEAAVGYNMSIYGEHFSEAAGLAVEWFVSNSTWNAELASVNGSLYTEVSTTADGNFTGYWIVSDSLLIGNTYTINATDANGLFAEFTITVVEEEMEIGPLLTTYQPGDTVAFTIKTIFAKTDAYLMISDPNEYPYWISTYGADDWVSVGDFQVVPFYRQVSDVNSLPITLPAGAMSGSWPWVLRSSVGEVIASGNFTVIDLSSSQVDPFTLNVSAGWNMVSLPFLLQDPLASSVLSDVDFYQLVTWSGTGYVVATEFELGKGYWLLVLEDTSITITG